MTDTLATYRADQLARRREDIAGEIAAKALLSGGGEIVPAIAAVFSPQVVARASIKLRAIEILLAVYLQAIQDGEEEPSR